METSSAGYEVHLCRPVKRGPGGILHRDIQEGQKGKMSESNLRVHGTSCAAPITADSESGKHLKENIQMVLVAVA